MTLSEAKSLERGQIIYHRYLTNYDGTPMRFKVNGRPRIWKRDTNRVCVPLKRGLYDYVIMTDFDLNKYVLTEEEAENG